jgi:hypothetical protein
MEEMERVA